jgi:amino acid transporter
MKSNQENSISNPHLLRRFGLLHATALNMSNMVGIGPFITIPLLLSALGGPQAMIGWLVGLLIVITDGLVWSELGAALPGSGGTYLYLREAFGRETFGRLMAFLFIWQFIISGPMEIASGYIGFAQFAGYIWRGLTAWRIMLVAAGVGIVNVLLLYRRITSVGKILTSLWVGTLLTLLSVMVTGALHFDSKLAFDFPTNAFQLSRGWFFGLGAATAIGVYDYLGYYSICYIGEEVKNPGRTIPRSILISVIAVAVMYLSVNLSIIGVVPWREFVPANATNPNHISNFVVSAFMERVYGARVSTAFTILVLWTAFASVFALLLSYSRIPYAAALDGYFFPIFGRLHPRFHFPHVSLLMLGILSIVCASFSLATVIAALLATRILVQFIGQIVAVQLLRQRQPALPRPFRIWLYPVPSVIALIGWSFIFVTTEWRVIAFGFGLLALGLLFFFAWSWRDARWPFTTTG